MRPKKTDGGDSNAEEATVGSDAMAGRRVEAAGQADVGVPAAVGCALAVGRGEATLGAGKYGSGKLTAASDTTGATGDVLPTEPAHTGVAGTSQDSNNAIARRNNVCSERGPRAST